MFKVFYNNPYQFNDFPYLYVFSPNLGKYGPEKLLVQTFFTQCY